MKKNDQIIIRVRWERYITTLTQFIGAREKNYSSCILHTTNSLSSFSTSSFKNDVSTLIGAIYLKLYNNDIVDGHKNDEFIVIEEDHCRLLEII